MSREVIRRKEAAAAGTSRPRGARRQLDDASAPASTASWESFLNPPDEATPEAATLEIGSIRITSGSRVRLQPARSADSMDICLAGRTATVTGIHRTLEDQVYVTVILDDDPFGAAGSRYRRALFFHPDEIVPLGAGPGATR